MQTTLLFLMMAVLIAVFYYHDRQKQQIEQRLFQMAYIDRLTGLGNESKLIADLRERLREKPERAMTIVSLDIASLKQINQIMGFAYGTELICTLGGQLKQRLEPDEGCYRIGGDVFSLMLVSNGAEEDWVRLEGMLLNISMAYGESHNHQLHFAAGAYTIDLSALGPAKLSEAALAEKLSDDSLEELCSNAELARKRGKKDGVNTLSFYTEEMLAKLLAERKLEEAIPPAVRNKEFVMYFQPKYTCKRQGAKLCGAEALVRWQHPQHGLLGPGRFMPLVERDGKSPEMDEHILELVCRQLAEWMAQGYQLVPVSFNVSRQTLLQGEKFLRDTEEMLTKYQIPREYVEIEVLESGSAGDERALTGILEELHGKGFHIDMDDFGSGYSSLGALSRMPVDCLKLDKSFFDDWSEGMDEKRAGIVRSIISMAHDMGKTVVTEGIEEAYQVELLEKFGADIVQGFYFGKAEPAEEFVKRMTKLESEGEKQ